MNKTIYYITDWQYEPGYYTFDRHRFPQAYLEQVPWYLVNYSDVDRVITGSGNVILANTPVHSELEKLKMVDGLIDTNDVYIVQEGSIWCWMYDWAAPEQELYIKILSRSKGFLCSNEYDRRMIRLFASNSILVPPCTNLFAETARESLGDYVFLVNPSKGYQRGMLSHKLVYDSVPTGLQVYSLEFNRSQHAGRMISLPDTYKLPGFQTVPRVGWDEFMQIVYGCRFGVDIHRDFSAGQTAVDFGSLGVPLVGNIQLDSQRIIFPDTSFEWDDYEGIKKCIYELSVDSDFCLEVGKKALANAKTNYNSKTVVSNFLFNFNQTQKIK